MNTEERLALITRNCQEIVTEDELRALLEAKKQPTVYLGTAITGRPHIAYFVWVLKLADFIKAGFKVKLLMADLHGALDNTPWEILEKRYEYYSTVIPMMFKAVGADIAQLEIVKGSSFQNDPKYFLDLLKLSCKSSIHDAKRAGSEVVKTSDNPKLSGLLYPLMQALDEEYLDVDVQYGGVDQRKILMFAREYLPKVGYKPRIEVMTPLLPGLVGKKMSASDPNSKIDLLDSSKKVSKKMNKAQCVEGVIEDNGILAFLEHVVFTVLSDAGKEFVIERPEKYGGNLSFSSYEEVEKAFAAKELHPLDLKNGVAAAISDLLSEFDKKRDKLEKLAASFDE
tara:strand:+ start:192 stop:1211 length:1020 start_codon:yes stop_codon:yes gene_type:complete